MEVDNWPVGCSGPHSFKCVYWIVLELEQTWKYAIFTRLNGFQS